MILAITSQKRGNIKAYARHSGRNVWQGNRVGISTNEDRVDDQLTSLWTILTEEEWCTLLLIGKKKRSLPSICLILRHRDVCDEFGQDPEAGAHPEIGRSLKNQDYMTRPERLWAVTMFGLDSTNLP